MVDHDSRQHVLQACRDHDVKFIRLWFTDILGMLKSVAITAEELEHALIDGVTFDGSAIEGFARQDEADMIAVPDPATFQILPWRPHPQAVARMFCDIRQQSGEEFLGDPRQVLRRNLKAAQKQGFELLVAPDMEYFYFAPPKHGEAPRPLDEGSFFDLTTTDVSGTLRKETIRTLEDQGRLTARLTERATKFIRANAGEKRPFFAYLAHPQPHTPLAAGSAFAPASEARHCRSAPRSIGFLRQAIIPAARHSPSNSGPVLALSATIGVRTPAARIRRVASSPSMTGMEMSMKIASYAVAVAAATAASPSSTDATRHPMRSSNRVAR